jgi:hypothetical protein
MEPVNAAFGHPTGKGTLKVNRALDRAVRHPQRIRGRLAATYLPADGFLQVDDRARLVHGRRIAWRTRGSESLFIRIARYQLQIVMVLSM